MACSVFEGRVDQLNLCNFSMVIFSHQCYFAIATCLPFLPKNGYYVHDIQQTYRPSNLLQIACKDAYDLISLESDSTYGVAECQADATWNDTFFCESMRNNYNSALITLSIKVRNLFMKKTLVIV